jgi:hypothetical protein
VGLGTKLAQNEPTCADVETLQQGHEYNLLILLLDVPSLLPSMAKECTRGADMIRKARRFAPFDGKLMVLLFESR